MWYAALNVDRDAVTAPLAELDTAAAEVGHAHFPEASRPVDRAEPARTRVKALHHAALNGHLICGRVLIAHVAEASTCDPGSRAASLC